MIFTMTSEWKTLQCSSMWLIASSMQVSSIIFCANSLPDIAMLHMNSKTILSDFKSCTLCFIFLVKS